MTPAEEELERAYTMLDHYGVPKERAKNLPNGIMVLMTRMDREVYALRHERGVLQKICAERSDELEALKAKLAARPEELPPTWREALRQIRINLDAGGWSASNLDFMREHGGALLDKVEEVLEALPSPQKETK